MTQMLTRQRALQARREFAEHARLKDVLHLKSLNSLKLLVAICEARNGLATVVTDASITVPWRRECLPLLRRLIPLLKELVSLELNSCGLRRWTILPLVFGKLTCFKTSTLPHLTVALITHHNPGLTFLSIGPCDCLDGRCPLSKIPNRQWEELSGSPGCVMGLIVNSPVTRLTMSYQTPRPDSPPSAHHLPDAFLDIERVYPSIETLQVDFVPEYADVLSLIGRRAPQVSFLTLSENVNWPSKLEMVRAPVWLRPEKWGDVFCSFAHLEIFMMKINGPLAWGAHAKHSVFRSWWRLAPQAPLRRVVVWSCAGGGRGDLDVWERKDGRWKMDRAWSDEDDMDTLFRAQII